MLQLQQEAIERRIVRFAAPKHAGRQTDRAREQCKIVSHWKAPDTDTHLGQRIFRSIQGLIAHFRALSWLRRERAELGGSHDLTGDSSRRFSNEPSTGMLALQEVRRTSVYQHRQTLRL